MAGSGMAGSGMARLRDDAQGGGRDCAGRSGPAPGDPGQYSGDNGGACVEVTATHETTAAPHKADQDVLYLMRDSKDPAGPRLAFTAAEWDAFIKGVKDGEFDPVS
jgi:Domain of unknown function (DUF397)